jgi:hypothetical protein
MSERSTGRPLGNRLSIRLGLPALFLVFHLVMLSALGTARFGRTLNNDWKHAPSFANPATDAVPDHWQRLITSRWDSQHYITIALRGYTYCAPREALGPTRFPDSDVVCQLNFFPGYAFLGMAVAKLTSLPVDYALFGISLLASFLAMFLWTSQTFQRALGTRTTYLSLLLLNVFTTGYSLVVVQTEPLALLLIIAAFIALEKRWLLFGALLAGAAGLVRPTAVASSAAYGLALIATCVSDRASRRIWVYRLSLGAVAGWGIVTLLAYNQWRFGDALVYAHARFRYYQYSPSITSLLMPKFSWLSQSLWAAPNEGIWLAAALLWFALGRKEAFRGFSLSGKVYWYATFVLIVGIAAAGQVEIGFSGMSRYVFLAIPMFFCTAAVLKRKPVALAMWVVFTLVHYWSVNACYYIGRGEPDFWGKCHIQPGA